MQVERAKRRYRAVLDWNKSHLILPSIVGKNACMLIEITGFIFLNSASYLQTEMDSLPPQFTV